MSTSTPPPPAPADHTAVLRHFSALATIADLVSIDECPPTDFHFSEPLGISDHPVFYAEYIDADKVVLPLVLSEGQLACAGLRQVEGKTVFDVPTGLGLSHHHLSFHRATVVFRAGARASLLSRFSGRFSTR